MSRTVQTITCHQCGKTVEKPACEVAPKGRAWKHPFCDAQCYAQWRAKRHLLFKANWLRLQREVWGTTEHGPGRVRGARQTGRAAEILARDMYLPAEGFTEIDDFKALSNQFFVDFIATYGGRRVLVDATIKLKAYLPHKARLAASLRMPLYIIHVAPARIGLYYLHQIAPGRIVCRVPAAFIRSLLPEEARA